VRWLFSADTGGTFTDCIARSPDGRLLVEKVLSSSAVKGRIGAGSHPGEIIDPDRRGEPQDFYRGFEIVLIDGAGAPIEARRAARFDGARGALVPDAAFSAPLAAAAYELRSPEEAPLFAVRKLLGLRLDEPIGAIDLRLGTTRGTNALLERRGARTAFVTTAGFEDVLLIGNQERPNLFALAIEKPRPLFEDVLEVEERIDARGGVLVALDLEAARSGLAALRARGIEALAICLLHAWRNPAHEEALAGLAAELGFPHVSVSSRSAPLPKLVPRGDTTVADAYLTPVLGRYVESIQRRAPEARIRLLTSAGGLAAPASFRGRDAILSGPAGGILGVARVAERAGFRRAIGFDMGGTSTDVSRWDGGFEMVYERELAGVRLAAPVLAIETVAAGGGSICGFDGERLVVGPESAGAVPGPACYGGGGPLTLTDANLFLGRVSEERFPFPLDRGAVERRLEELAARVAAAGHARSPVELALGFLEIADTRMAAAIRKISVRRGYDAREHVLVAFGGAGGQHACAVARELGMRQVLVPGLAGVLSAFGAGMAEVRKFAERAVLEPFGEGTLARLEPLFAELESAARAEVAAGGVEPERIERPRRRLEMRYLGQDATLEIEAEGDCRRRFEEAHERLYGYLHAGRPLEVVAARVECSGSSSRSPATELSPPEAATPGRGRLDAARSWRRAVFGGREERTAYLPAEALAPSESVSGPAIIASAHHTAVVEPGWTARRTLQRDLLLVLEDGGPAAATAGEEVDPVRLEIFHQHFAAIAEEMGLVLRRSALSTNIRERLDFSCAIFDARGDLVANAPHVPVHIGAMGDCVKRLAEDIPDLGPGDVIVTNDPYRGGSHLPDVTVVAPVHDSEGGLLFYVASRAHHAEIGGKRPGSMPPDSRSLAEEGVLIRAFRAVERGAPRLEELRALLEAPPYPSRSPRENLADIAAQMAANRAGAARLAELVEARGRAVVLAYMQHIQDASRRLMEAELARLPQGSFAFADALDDGTPIAVSIEVSGGRATIDFTRSGAVHPGNLNAPPAVVRSAVLYSFRLLIERDIPLNAGVLLPLRIVLAPGLLDPPAASDPARCPAVAGGNVETSQRLVDVLLGALGVAAASQGTMNNLILGDASFGYYETIAGGAGAGAGFAGADAVQTHMTNTRITDPEVLESRYPLRLRRFAIRRGSGGAGLQRGGDGVVREIELLAPLEVSILSQRRTRAPYGLAGGAPGKPGRNLLRRRGDERWEELPPIATFMAGPGDLLRIETPGGGGWGAPRRKSPEEGYRGKMVP
jgi:5-oxoprolinase (ATP-hydrolysing)